MHSHRVQHPVFLFLLLLLEVVLVVEVELQFCPKRDEAGTVPKPEETSWFAVTD